MNRTVERVFNLKFDVLFLFLFRLFACMVSLEEGGSLFGIGRPRSRGGRISDLYGQREWGVLKIGQF